MITTLENAAMPEPDYLLSVRSGKLKALGKEGIMSGIDKQAHTGSVDIASEGIPGDQIGYWAHGGPEKALHQYSSSHYPTWQHEKPEKKQKFKIGAFGENLSVEHLNEENVCIGDIFKVGSDVVIQVTEPRLPCYKLNARFDWPQAAKRVTKTGRTGWYFRILKTGTIKENDRQVLVKRENPRWSVKNTLRVLLGNDVDTSLAAELSALEGVTPLIRDMAAERASGKAENTMARTKGAAFDWSSYEVEDARMITPRIRQLTLAYNGPVNRLCPVTNLGSHAYVRLKFGPEDDKFERSYSVVSGDMDKLVLGIALDDHSRGGSKYLHESLKTGDSIELVRGDSTEAQAPKDFDPSSVARHIFIIGGIRVTAFLREIEDLRANGSKAKAEVHYACRSMEQAAYKDKLPEGTTTYYAKDQKKRLNVNDIIPGPDDAGKFDSIVYACGPNSLMDAVEDRCNKLGYPQHLLHLESFGAPTDGPLGDPFEVAVKDLDSEKEDTVTVPAEQSLLDTLNKAGFEVPFSCRAGRCGVCVVNLKCGEVKHKGTGLMEDAKATSMLSCVSRGMGKIEIEIE